MPVFSKSCFWFKIPDPTIWNKIWREMSYVKSGGRLGAARIKMELKSKNRELGFIEFVFEKCWVWWFLESRLVLRMGICMRLVYSYWRPVSQLLSSPHHSQKIATINKTHLTPTIQAIRKVTIKRAIIKKKMEAAVAVTKIWWMIIKRVAKVKTHQAA